MSLLSVRPRETPGLNGSELVVRVRTRATLERPEVTRLIMRAAEACRLPADQVMAELKETIGSPALGVFVGFSDEWPKVVGVGLLPVTVWQMAPFVVMAYAEAGSRNLWVAIVKRLREWIEKAGYSEAMCINFLHTDRSFLRASRSFGRGSRFGSVLRFE